MFKFISAPTLVAAGVVTSSLIASMLVGSSAHATIVSSHTEVVTRSNAVLGQRVIGHSVRGRRIVAFHKGNPLATRKVVILGQMHGDEKAGVTTANYIINRVPVALDADVWIIPSLNPDGFAHNRRTNAHGVDLNRNWPMNFSRSGSGTETYSGPHAASEPETRALMAFLAEVQPQFVSSIHQPYGEIGYYRDKPIYFQRRLSYQLGLPLHGIGIGIGRLDQDPARTSATATTPTSLQPGGSDNTPTLTGWYNAHYPGTAITVEYTHSPSDRFKTIRAGYGLIRASRAY